MDLLLKENARNRRFDCASAPSSPRAAPGLFILLSNALQLFCSLSLMQGLAVGQGWQSHSPRWSAGKVVGSRGAPLHPGSPGGAHVIALRAQSSPNHPSNCITRQSAGLQLNPSSLGTGSPGGAAGKDQGCSNCRNFPSGWPLFLPHSGNSPSPVPLLQRLGDKHGCSSPGAAPTHLHSGGKGLYPGAPRASWSICHSWGCSKPLPVTWSCPVWAESSISSFILLP